MLEMVPLSQNEDDVEAAGDPSATAFFAIPAPKAERARPGPPAMGGGPPPSASAIGVSGPPPPRGMGGGPPPPMHGRPPMGQPPPAASQGPMGIGVGNAGGGPPPPQGIQGPVASYGGNAPPGGSPFQVGGQQQQGGTQGTQQKERVRSQVVWVVLFGAFVFMGGAAMLAVYLMRANQGGGEEVVADAGSRRSASTAGNDKPRVKENASLDDDDGATDTGLTRKKKRPIKKKRSTSRGSGGGSKAAAPAPRAPSGPANVSLNMPGIPATAVEINCPGGTRKKVAVQGGKATFSAIPQEDCTIFTKGGQPGKYGPVRGGMSLTCTQSGTNLSCR